MARMRTIKPEMFRSFTVSSWPLPVRWTFAGLLTYCDDSGRAVDDPRLLKAEVYPIDDDMSVRKVEQHLDEIGRNGPLCRYEIAGRRYLHITSWGEHQRINRPTASRIPPCPVHEPSLNPHGGLSEGSVSPPGAVSEPSLPRAQARAPAEHGAREQGSKGAREREQGSREKNLASELRADVERLCGHLADRIEGNGCRRPTVSQRWRDAARLLLDRDGRTEAQAHAAIDWCQDDEFWRGNILSMPKLREKYDQLRLQAQRNRTPADAPTVTHIDTWQATKELDRQLAEHAAERAAELRDLLPDMRDI